MTCLVTGILHDLSGNVLPDTRVYFTRREVVGQAGNVVSPQPSPPDIITDAIGRLGRLVAGDL